MRRRADRDAIFEELEREALRFEADERQQMEMAEVSVGGHKQDDAVRRRERGRQVRE